MRPATPSVSCRRRLLLAAAAALPAGALYPAAGHAAAEAPLVFVSLLPQKQFVERVAGDAVRVEVLVRPGQSPHSYDPTPQQIVRLSSAVAYFRIGAPFETPWMPRLQAVHPRLRVVDTRAGVQLLPMPGRGQAHGHGPGPGGTSAPAARLDPHIWTDPLRVKQQAANIRDALVELLPARRARFEAGYAAYAAELDALDAELRQVLAGKTDRRFMVFHPAWGYLAHSYGLQQLPVEIEGKEPGPQALAHLIGQAQASGVRVVFVQRQFGRASAQAVARAIGGAVVELDPLAEDFVGNTRAAVQALAQAMR